MQKIAKKEMPTDQVEHFNETTNNDICLQQDNTINDKLSQFKELKTQSEYLVDSYFRLGEIAKASRVGECGTLLKFAQEIRQGKVQNDAHLIYANFCRDRLCPLCTQRRSAKIFAQVSTILDNMILENSKFIFLTLTIPNVSAHELDQTLDQMQQGFKKMMERKEIKKIAQGYFKALEITYNKTRNDYHPHYHILIQVKNSYFKSRDYITQKRWLKLWQQSMNNERIQFVNVQAVVGQLDCLNNQITYNKAIREIAKYSVKSNDYLFKGDEHLTDTVVRTLSKSLKNRRLVSYGGTFKSTWHTLHLENPNAKNLNLTDYEQLNQSLDWLVTTCCWCIGYQVMNTETLTQRDRLRTQMAKLSMKK